MGTAWKPVAEGGQCLRGTDRATGDAKWTHTGPGWIWCSAPIAVEGVGEVYGADDASETFVHQFVKAWDKVMNLDRFELV